VWARALHKRHFEPPSPSVCWPPYPNLPKRPDCHFQIPSEQVSSRTARGSRNGGGESWWGAGTLFPLSGSVWRCWHCRPRQTDYALEMNGACVDCVWCGVGRGGWLKLAEVPDLSRGISRGHPAYRSSGFVCRNETNISPSSITFAMWILKEWLKAMSDILQ